MLIFKTMNEEKFITLQEATGFCPYTQEYLSLRARQGKLKAVKTGRNWKTTELWVRRYLEEASDQEKMRDFKSGLTLAGFKKLPGKETQKENFSFNEEKREMEAGGFPFWQIAFLLFIITIIVTVVIPWTKQILSDIGKVSSNNLSMFYNVFNLNESFVMGILNEYFFWLISLF